MFREFLQQFISPSPLQPQPFTEKVSRVAEVTYTIAMGFVFVYQFLFRERFHNLILKYKSVHRRLDCSESLMFPKLPIPAFNSQGSFSYSSVCCLVTISYLILGIFENFLFDLESLRKEAVYYLPINNKSSSWDRLYWINFYYWRDFISEHNSAATFLFVVLDKISICGWIITDCFVIALCYSLKINFQLLNEAIRLKMKETKFGNTRMHSVTGAGMGIRPKSSSTKEMSDAWRPMTAVIALPLELEAGSEANIGLKNLTDEFWILAKLAKDTEEYVGSIIAALYVCIAHILLIGTRFKMKLIIKKTLIAISTLAKVCILSHLVFAWAAPEIPVALSTTNSIHIYYSTFYYFFRVSIVTYFASEVYHSSQAILGTVEQLPNLPQFDGVCQYYIRLI